MLLDREDDWTAAIRRALGPAGPPGSPVDAAVGAIREQLDQLLGERPLTFVLFLAGFALFVLALVVTLVIEVPIAERIAIWTVPTLPGDWQRQRDRWAAVHIVRVVSGIGGLGLLVSGAIFG